MFPHQAKQDPCLGGHGWSPRDFASPVLLGHAGKEAGDFIWSPAAGTKCNEEFCKLGRANLRACLGLIW